MEGQEVGFNPELKANQQEIINAFAEATKNLYNRRSDYESQGLSASEINDRLSEERKIFGEALEALEN